jgi:RES domain-containing protein
MEIFKICKEKYAQNLQASGVSNRWNKKDEFVIYAGSSRSLSTLETVVQRSGINTAHKYKMLKINIDDSIFVKEISIIDLPIKWESLEAYVDLQEIGSKWYQSNESLVLKVPSVIIKEEFNFVINTKHPFFEENVKLAAIEDFFWDKRFF